MLLLDAMHVTLFGLTFVVPIIPGQFLNFFVVFEKRQVDGKETEVFLFPVCVSSLKFYLILNYLLVRTAPFSSTGANSDSSDFSQ